jgi:hypothetical protein
MTVAKTGHGRAATSVEVLLAGVIVEIHTFATKTAWILVVRVSVKDAAHIRSNRYISHCHGTQRPP